MDSSDRRTILCIFVILLVIGCGFLIYSFIARNLGLFPFLETDEPLELSWVEGPPEGDIYKGIWYNDSLVLSLKNTDPQNDYHLFNYIIISHDTYALEDDDITIAVSTYLETFDAWTEPETMALEETEDILGEPFLQGQYGGEEDIIPAKDSSPNWQRQIRICFKISEDAPDGTWEMVIRILGNFVN